VHVLGGPQRGQNSLQFSLQFFPSHMVIIVYGWARRGSDTWTLSTLCWSEEGGGGHGHLCVSKPANAAQQTVRDGAYTMPPCGGHNRGLMTSSMGWHVD
jgi:hypothetical protein